MPIEICLKLNRNRQLLKLAISIALTPIFFFGQISHGAEKSFCFAMAESYYEQLYCEIQAKGEGKSLPAFYQFKSNNEQTQALLLKRPAAKIGVEVKAPTLNSRVKKARIALPTTQPSSAPAKVANNPTPAPRAQSKAPTPIKNSAPQTAQRQGCSLTEQEIRCGQQHFRLLTNLHNKHLGNTALESTNKMALPRFTGDMNNEAQVREYLYLAYEQYLNQMRSIGLAGVTTRFGKFSYLFYDYHDKGLDFPNRFETLFHYLKKDKAALGVSERPADSSGMTLEQCAWLSSQYTVCEYGNSNLVYAAQ